MTYLQFVSANSETYGMVEFLETLLGSIIESFATTFSDSIANSFSTLIYSFLEQIIQHLFGGLMIGGVLLGILALVLPILGILSLIVIAVLLIVGIIKYLITAIGVTRVAKKLGVRRRILAWLPICNYFIIGKCAEHAQQRKGKKALPWGWLILIGALLTVVAPALILFASEIFSWLVLAVLPAATVIIELVQILSNIAVYGVGLLYSALFAFCAWLTYREFMSTPGSIFWALLTLFFNVYGFVFFIVGFMKLNPVKETSAPAKRTEDSQSSDGPAVLEPDRIE